MRHRLPGIDIARAVAASAVVIGHLTLSETIWTADRLATLSPKALKNVDAFVGAMGAWGVGLFFVLSGLCIHLPFARRQAADLDARPLWVPYFKRRFTRIYPPHLVALLLSVGVASFAVLAPFGLQSLLSVTTKNQFAAHVLMAHTFVPSARYSGNAVLWTIAIETHFYLLYPLLLAGARRWGMVRVAAALFGLSTVLHGVETLGFSTGLRGVLTSNFPGRWWEWALGCVVAERLVGARVPRSVPSFIIWPLLAGTYFAGVSIAFLPHGLLMQGLVWPPLFAWVLFLMARMDTSPSSIFDRWSIRIGVESYSLYLVHPIGLTLVFWASRTLALPMFVETLLALASAALLTHGFFLLIERPFLSAARRAHQATFALARNVAGLNRPTSELPDDARDGSHH